MSPVCFPATPPDRGSSFAGLAVDTFADVLLHTSEETSPVKVIVDPLVCTPDPLVSTFQSGVIVMQDILMQRLRCHQSHQSISICIRSLGGWAIEQQIITVDLVVRCEVAIGSSLILCQISHISHQILLHTRDSRFFILCSTNPIDPQPSHELLLHDGRVRP